MLRLVQHLVAGAMFHFAQHEVTEWRAVSHPTLILSEAKDQWSNGSEGCSSMPRFAQHEAARSMLRSAQHEVTQFRAVSHPTLILSEAKDQWSNGSEGCSVRSA